MRIASIIFAFILCLSLVTGCKTFTHVGEPPPAGKSKLKHKGKGPPPHAPAHGYRHKHKNGIKLQFDSGLGVYFSIKKPSIYFYNNLFMKLSDRHWKVASNFNGPWRSEVKGEVPNKLKQTKKEKHKSHGKKKEKKKKKK